MKEKMRKVRYPMLIVWGIFMGAAGTAGVKFIVACNTWMVDRCYCHIGNHGDVNLDDFREK